MLLARLDFKETSGQRQVGLRSKVKAGEFASLELWESGGGDHGCIVGGECGGGEIEFEITLLRSCSSQPGIAGNSAGDDDGLGVDGLRRRHRSAHQLLNDCVLKTRDQVQSGFRSVSQPSLDGGCGFTAEQ